MSEPNDDMPSLADMVAALASSGKATLAAKKKTNKKKSPNPHKTIQAKKSPTGTGFIYEEVDSRLLDPHWSDQHRVLLIREVHCNQCELIQSAPNEQLMIRKEHVRHGMLEEAISIHEARYDHLPIKIETIRSNIHICQHCVTIEQSRGSNITHSAQEELPFDTPIAVLPAAGDSPSPESTPTISVPDDAPAVTHPGLLSINGNTECGCTVPPAVATDFPTLTGPPPVHSAAGPSDCQPMMNSESDTEDSLWEDGENLAALEGL